MNPMPLHIKIIPFLILGMLSSFTQTHETESSVLWKAGSGEYASYRIPSIIEAPDKSLLAFCEGRKERSDAGEIAILMRRSHDGGGSWEEEELVMADGENTLGNPCPVLDIETGRIWMFLTWNLGTDKEKASVRKESRDTRHPYLCYSDDSGKTWSEPVDMLASCKDSSWGWYATGPGIGIQLTSGDYKGRMVIPANHSYDDPEGFMSGVNGKYGYGAHVLISDDHGETWRMGDPIRPGCNESQVVELSDASLLMNMRSYNDQHSRAIAQSFDGGETWTEIWHDYQLSEPKCQASIIKHPIPQGKELILFSNPATAHGRTHMTIKASRDGAKTWYSSRLINAGRSGYSCLVSLPGGDVGILYETGEEYYAENLVFERFHLSELFPAD